MSKDKMNKMDTSKCYECIYSLDNFCMSSYNECPQNEEEYSQNKDNKNTNTTKEKIDG